MQSSILKINPSMQQPKRLSEKDKQKVNSFYANQDIAIHLINQINAIYSLDIADQFIFSLHVEHLHLYLYAQRCPKGKEKQCCCTYSISVGKSYPLSGVRVYALGNQFLPGLFDCRDLYEQIVGTNWNYDKKLSEIIECLGSFEKKLSSRSNKYLSMQKTGQFQLADLFDIQQFSKFATMDVFPDLLKDSLSLLVTTETHLLTFKLVPSKEKNKKIYQLTRACELQCITDLRHNRKTGEIIITLCQYRKVKSFDEYEKISRKYKVQEVDGFLRNILKNIVNFQKIDINLELSASSWKGEPEIDKIIKKISQTKTCEQKLCLHQTSEQKKNLCDNLMKNYHKIMEFFSERANAYYLIFVRKLVQASEKYEDKK